MLQPKKTKYRKSQRWVLKWIATRWSDVSFWEFGLKTIESWFITARQIESARRVIVRYLKKWWKIWIRIFPYKSYTKKPLEVPMGWGKGSVEMYLAPVKPGRILFELSWVSSEVAREAFNLAAYKLPVKTKVII